MLSKPDRRTFLRGCASGTAMGLSGFPAIVPGSAMGLNGTVPPSERITLGMIGMGKMCWGHLGDMLGRDNVEVLALCDPESQRLEKCRNRVAEEYSKKSGTDHTGCATYRDFRNLIARPDIDAVLIGTPTNWHAVMSVEAAKAGKDVYCEKPLALTAKEAQAIVDATHTYQTVFQTGSQQRSDYKFRFACELVRNSRIGKIKCVNVNVGGPPVPCYLPAMPVPPTLDWNMWLGPAPLRPYNSELCPMDDYDVFPHWRRYRDYCGGGMYDFGAHHFDIAQWGLGMDGSGPVEIIPPDGKENKRLTYRYDNGICVYHKGADGGANIEFVGTDGHVRVSRKSLFTKPESLMRVKWGPDDIKLYKSLNQKTNWLECIRSRRRTICPAEIGCSTLTVCHLGNIAYQLKRPLRWDPEKRGFKNDPLANRLLQRPMRSPWRV